MKDLLLRVLTSPAVAACFGPLLRERATVFMLHRLSDPEHGVLGNDEAALRNGLTYLRRSGRRIVSLEEIFDSLGGHGPPLRGAVAFTVDDGYQDQATRLARVFAEFDCPATVFVCTGFLDGRLWLWWDQIEYAFRHAAGKHLRVSLAGEALAYDLSEPGARRRSQLDFTERCKRIPADSLPAAVDGLAEAAEVELPEAPPPPYRPMTWEQLRACEGQGIRFGAHTVTHPILSRSSDSRSAKEIAESWKRLREEAERPVPIFCYPNGQAGDFGPREVATLEGLGLRGALSATPGYANATACRRGIEERFRVPRFPFPDSLPHLRQYSTGLERAKQIARREAV